MLACCSSAAGIRNGTPDALIRCLAREMRCAIVASSTMNARPISAVVNPPTARSVRAIAEAGVSAGWQHMNRTVKRVVLRRTPHGRRRLLQGGSRLPVLAGLLAPPLVDQPPLGDLDQPATRAGRDAVSGPVHGRREQRLLNGILGGVEVAIPAGEHAEDLRRELAQQGLDVGLARQRTPPQLTSLARGSVAAAQRRQAPARPSTSRRSRSLAPPTRRRRSCSRRPTP